MVLDCRVDGVELSSGFRVEQGFKRLLNTLEEVVVVGARGAGSLLVGVMSENLSSVYQCER